MNPKTIYCKATPRFLSITRPLPYFPVMERGSRREQTTADHAQNPSYRLCVTVRDLCLDAGLHLLCCREGPSRRWAESCGPCRQKWGAGLLRLMALASLGSGSTTTMAAPAASHQQSSPQARCCPQAQSEEVWHCWLWAMGEYFIVQNLYGQEGSCGFQISSRYLDFRHLVLFIMPSVVISILLSPAKNPKPPLKFLWFSVLL